MPGEEDKKNKRDKKNKDDGEKHVINFRVYYEDTDAGGVMYHASYFKFAERARTEMFRFIGFGQHDMRTKQGILFVVRFAEAEYLKPARLDDLVSVYSCVEKLSKSSIIIKQVFKKDKEIICQVRVVVICIKENFKPTGIPKELYDVMKGKECPAE